MKGLWLFLKPGNWIVHESGSFSVFSLRWLKLPVNPRAGLLSCISWVFVGLLRFCKLRKTSENRSGISVFEQWNTPTQRESLVSAQTLYISGVAKGGHSIADCNTIQYNGKFALKNWQTNCQFNLAHRLKRTETFKKRNERYWEWK